jgi:mannitol-1-phosphate 5-dehydrogenase
MYKNMLSQRSAHVLLPSFTIYMMENVNTINSAMENKQIIELVEGALNESGEFLVKKYGFDRNEHSKYIQKIIQRFSNSYIVDDVTRVGRSPIRKLGPNDRLVSPARQYMEVVGGEPVYLMKGIAAALMYDFHGDEEAVQVQTTINNQGLEAAIQEYTQLERSSALFKGIIEQYNQLKRNK